MEACTCDYCGKEFFRFHCKIKRAKKHFCCKKCEVNYRKEHYVYKKRKNNEIILCKEYAIIVIENNDAKPYACQVDLEDIENLKHYYWQLKYDKRHPDLIGYIETHIKGKRIFMHRFLMNPTINEVVDHINGNTFDNRKKNLRICSQSVNCKNKQKAKNIYYNKRDDVYIVSFSINRKAKYICYTRDYKEAEKYAIWGRTLLVQNRVEELLSTSCKCLKHSYQRQNNV